MDNKINNVPVLDISNNDIVDLNNDIFDNENNFKNIIVNDIVNTIKITYRCLPSPPPLFRQNAFWIPLYN